VLVRERKKAQMMLGIRVQTSIVNGRTKVVKEAISRLDKIDSLVKLRVTTLNRMLIQITNQRLVKAVNSCQSRSVSAECETVFSKTMIQTESHLA
jgi:hypothetical protein